MIDDVPSLDPDVPVPETNAASADPLVLPIDSFVNGDDVVCLPDGTQVGILITGGRDLIEDYIETISITDAPSPYPPEVEPLQP